jgi:hypothetical protein
MVYTKGTMPKLSEIVERHEFSLLDKDYVTFYGNLHDGIIEMPPITKDGGLVEMGYYFGDVKPKYIIDISSQVGCPMKCIFCETGKEQFKRSLTPDEMYEEALLLLKTAYSFGVDIDAKKHKVTIAKTGEPMMNRGIVEAVEKISELGVSYKISTVFPAANVCLENFRRLAMFASGYSESVQPQISIISTSEEYRRHAAGNAAPFRRLREAGEIWKAHNPHGRRVNLSLILTEQVPCDVKDVCGMFPPDMFKFRFRNYVPTHYGNDNSLSPITPERMRGIKQDFRENGYDVDDWATPTPMEMKFGIASNVTRRRYKQIVGGLF